jgi:hypothetical protein
MTGQKSIPVEKIVRGILALVQKIMRERGHGEVVIVIRDGMICRLDERRSYLPQNLPEA